MNSEKTDMGVLVTGGAGYIGSHMVLKLIDSGETDVFVLDDLSSGSRDLVPDEVAFTKGDVGNSRLVSELIEYGCIDKVLHFAGSIIVSESVRDPVKYLNNNAVKTGILAETCAAMGVRSFVFSSTAAVYGEPEVVPIAEGAKLDPVSPYGLSKLTAEKAILDACHGTLMSSAVLRYFNVAGADPKGRSGQSGAVSTHLIKIASEAATGKRDGMGVFGTDYDTADGTCVRDYIHVSDLAHVHQFALSFLEENSGHLTINCGYGEGYSVNEVIDAVKRVSGVDFPVSVEERRDGDPATLVADSTQAQKILNWSPQYNDLDLIVSHALNWEGRTSAA